MIVFVEGDVNGDGFDDVIIGALRMNDALAGAAYIVYGKPHKIIQALKLTNIETTDYTVLSGEAHSWFGYSVSGAGNIYLLLALLNL